MDDRVARLKELPIAERVRQLGNPMGALGIAIGDYINVVNGALNVAAFRRLSLRSGDRVLEIGFGNGKLLPDLMALRPAIIYDGIDISQQMVAEAISFNHELVSLDRARFHCASSRALPFDSGTFDRVIAVNTIYFWPEPIRDLTEVHRVLNSAGALVLAAMTPDGASHLRASGESFRTYEEDELRSLLTKAGFSRIEIEPYRETVPQPDGRTIERMFHLVHATA
jgi:SAM-dependent methyltransferase